MSALNLKECSNCHLYKQTTEFYKGKKKVDGTRSIRGDCKTCYLKKNYTPKTSDVVTVRVSSSIFSIEALPPVADLDAIESITSEVKEQAPHLEIDLNSEPIKPTIEVNEFSVPSYSVNSSNDFQTTVPLGGHVKEICPETITTGILQHVTPEVSHPHPREEETRVDSVQVVTLLLKQIETQSGQLSQLDRTMQELRKLVIQDREAVQNLQGTVKELQDSAAQDRAIIKSLQIALETERKEVSAIKTRQDIDTLSHPVCGIDMRGLFIKYYTLEQNGKTQSRMTQEQLNKLENLHQTITLALTEINKVCIRDIQEVNPVSGQISNVQGDVIETGGCLKNLACQISYNVELSDHKGSSEYKQKKSIPNSQMLEIPKITPERISNHETPLRRHDESSAYLFAFPPRFYSLQR